MVNMYCKYDIIIDILFSTTSFDFVLFNLFRLHPHFITCWSNKCSEINIHFCSLHIFRLTRSILSHRRLVVSNEISHLNRNHCGVVHTEYLLCKKWVAGMIDGNYTLSTTGPRRVTSDLGSSIIFSNYHLDKYTWPSFLLHKIFKISIRMNTHPHRIILIIDWYKSRLEK